MRYLLISLFVVSTTVSAQEPAPGSLPWLIKRREADRRVACMKKLKEIAVALRSHHAVEESFPARSVRDANGKELLSWRVSILPYLDQQDLYEQFHLDEPWDSEHNKMLLTKMPKVYQNPNHGSRDKTLFLAVVSKESAFGGESGVKVADITDGTTKTLFIIEANTDHAVPWTKPSDWNYDPQKPRKGIGKLRTDGFLGVFGDSSVHFLPNTMKDDVLHNMITIARGEMVEGP